VDIGGTFTDVALAGDDGAVAVAKVPSTPDDYARGVLDGVRHVLARTGRAPGEASAVVHGTTVATNALLERRGARTGLLTTRGFRDILEIRRLRVPRLYDLTWEKPPPLVERALRLEVDERLDAGGGVLRPLDEAGAAAAIGQLRAAGVEAIAVCLLHAYANPAHEARLGALLRELAPGTYCSLSHQVLPQIQEYERTSTTVINAYLGPTVERYLATVLDGLAALGLRAPLLVMQSNGGCMGAAAARRLPAALVESGPAAGVIAAAALGRAAGERCVLALDMGGTTAKAALLQDGRIPLSSETEIGAGVTVANRLNRGGGYLLSLPAVDLVEVGAGGGSLLWIDPGGVLCVGPQSAGAAPGPACYAAGGLAPTLTDANVVLGYLNPDWLLGGALPLDAGAAHRAVAEQVARPLGLPPEAAAFGAYRVAVASMVRAVRAVSAERGHDPREAALVAFGGNGPLHAAAVAQALGMPRVLVPPSPGLFSAFGLLAAEVEHHFLRTHLRRLDQLGAGDLDALNRVVGDLAAAARATLAAEGYPSGRTAFQWAADLRYLGQSYELSVPLAVRDDAALDAAGVAALAHAFGDAHERTYGHRAAAEPVELVNVRLAARGVPSAPRGLPAGPPAPGAPAGRGAPGAPGADGGRAGRAPRSRRRAYFGPERGWAETPVIARADLGSRPCAGPLIVEEYDATTLVPPGWRVRLDGRGTIVQEPGETSKA
jgi:N-methylhydantoinase A